MKWGIIKKAQENLLSLCPYLKDERTDLRRPVMGCADEIFHISLTKPLLKSGLSSLVRWPLEPPTFLRNYASFVPFSPATP
jgi:hypothetical protein